MPIAPPAYPVHKAKGIAEEHIRKSGVPHTIVRSSIIYGPEDHFTTNIASLLRSAPIFFPMPGDGQTLIQPLWVEDLVTCLLWAMENPETVNKTYEVGGSEYFAPCGKDQTIMNVIGKRRVLVPTPQPSLRALVVTFETFIPRFPGFIFLDRLLCRPSHLPGRQPAAYLWPDAGSIYIPVRLFSAHILVCSLVANSHGHDIQGIFQNQTYSTPHAKIMAEYTIRLLETPEDMTVVEELQRIVGPAAKPSCTHAHAYYGHP